VLDNNFDDQIKTVPEEASLDEEQPVQAQMSNGFGPEPAAEEQSVVFEHANDIDEGTSRAGHSQPC